MWAVGKRPLADEHLAKLGILHEKPAPVCVNPKCEGYGEPHVYDCRTQQVKAKSKPRVRKKWRDISKTELLWALANRHETDWSNNVTNG
jgi:hypothetical protein